MGGYLFCFGGAGRSIEKRRSASATYNDDVNTHLVCTRGEGWTTRHIPTRHTPGGTKRKDGQICNIQHTNRRCTRGGVDDMVVTFPIHPPTLAAHPALCTWRCTPPWPRAANCRSRPSTAGGSLPCLPGCCCRWRPWGKGPQPGCCCRWRPWGEGQPDCCRCCCRWRLWGQQQQRQQQGRRRGAGWTSSGRSSNGPSSRLVVDAKSNNKGRVWGRRIVYGGGESSAAARIT